MENTSGIFENIFNLPKGGGSISSIGEKFQPDLLKGTGNYSIPIRVLQGPNNIKPEISLKYSTGTGNGPFGMGWNITGLLNISRRTDKGVPYYNNEKDQFIFSNADVLVNIGENRFRPASDTKYWDIRFLNPGWQVRTKKGKTYIFGTTNETRIEDNSMVFSWLLEKEIDNCGNQIDYKYFKHKNNLYIKEISWGIYSLKFIYENRPDIIKNGRPGFIVKTSYRCKAIENHCNTESKSLLTKYDLLFYEHKQTKISLLKKIHYKGFDKTGNTEEYPPVIIEYTDFTTENILYKKIKGNKQRLPSINSPDTTFIDMNGDGLPDILKTDFKDHRYWINKGNGEFGNALKIERAPYAMHLNQKGISFIDLTGDYAPDMIKVSNRLNVCVKNNSDGTWSERPEFYKNQLSLSITKNNTRFYDLDGSGITDIIQSEKKGFLLTYNQGKGNWSKPNFIPRIYNNEEFPDIDFKNKNIRLHDMTGDGLTDIVFISSGIVEYWPYLGRGHWDKKIKMKNSPVLPNRFKMKNLFISDLTGDGTGDIVYIDFDKVYFWLNQCGEGWSEKQTISFIPPPGKSSIFMADMYGKGTRGIVWESRHNSYGYSDISFLDFTYIKPFLLSKINNGFGSIIEIKYDTTSSSKSNNNQQNILNTYLPFPVQIVREIKEKDLITQKEKNTFIKYNGGYFDAFEKEFRGFSNVEVEMQGDEYSPTMIQQTDHFIGSACNLSVKEGIPLKERYRERSLSGSPKEIRVYYIDQNGEKCLHQKAIMEWHTRLEYEDENNFVYFPYIKKNRSIDYKDQQEKRIDSAEYEYDVYCNLISRTRKSWFTDQAENEALFEKENFTYTKNLDKWLVGLTAEIEKNDKNDNILKHKINYYDGNDFQGLDIGKVSKGLITRTMELEYISHNFPENYENEIQPEWGFKVYNGRYYIDKVANKYDIYGNLIAQKDELGNIKTIEYQNNGIFPLKMTDQDNRVTEAEFDPRTGQPLKIIFPDKNSVIYKYSSLGRLVAQHEVITDGSLELTQVFKVNYGNLQIDEITPPSVMSILPIVKNKTIDEFNNVTGFTEFQGVNIAIDYYDSQGNLLQRIKRGPDNQDGTKTWISCKRRIYTVTGEPAIDYPDKYINQPIFLPILEDEKGVSFHYGPGGQVTEILKPDNGRLKVNYCFDRIEKWDANMADHDSPMIEEYNAWGQLIGIKQNDDMGNIISTRYNLDLYGRTTEIIDPDNRPSVKYKFAGPGHVIEIEHSDAGKRRYYRDSKRQLRLVTNNMSRRLIMNYNNSGRITETIDQTDINNPVCVRKIIYKDQQISKVIEGDITIDYFYDPVGRLTKESINFKDNETLTLEKKYGFRGELKRIKYPDNTTVDYLYSESNALIEIPGWVDNILYNASGNPIKINYNENIYIENQFDEDNQKIINSNFIKSDKIIREHSYQYDLNGNITVCRDNAEGNIITRKYDYDNLYRLKRARAYQGELNDSLIKDDVYDYSYTGNIIKNTESIDGDMLYKDVAHSGRLTDLKIIGSDSSQHLSYDPSGRLLNFNNLKNIEYDIWDRIKKIILEDSTIIEYSYDNLGNRIEKKIKKEEQVFITRYFGKYYKKNQNSTKKYIYLGKKLIGEKIKEDSKETKRYLFTDYLQNLLSSCNETGDDIHQQIYSPFGLMQNNQTQSNLYNGKSMDYESGLIQFGSRYYSPILGRFITPDWFIIENPSKTMRIPQGLNIYSYAINNPIAFRDTTGLWFGLDDLLVAAIGFVVGFVAGLIYGLATGQGWNSLLVGLEAGLVGAIGGWLAYATAGTVLGLLGIPALEGIGLGIAVTAAAIGGLNGVISGMTQIYDWKSITGWGAFLTDSTWGLLGTTLGLVVHFVNLFYGITGDRNYRSDLSKRQNRHVYDGGFGFGGFAFTQGNVISNLSGRGGTDLLDHEMLHVWQSRLFGPIFQVTHIAWFIVGGFIGFCIGLGTDQPLDKDILDVAYYNNPWEIWAYNVGGTPKGGRLSWI